MIVGYFNIVRVFPVPAEAEPVLSVDPNGVFSLAISSKRMKFVSGWYLQKVQLYSGVELAELAQGGGMNVGGKFRGGAAPPNYFRRLVGEALDHRRMLVGTILASSASITC